MLNIYTHLYKIHHTVISSKFSFFFFLYDILSWHEKRERRSERKRETGGRRRKTEVRKTCDFLALFEREKETERNGDGDQSRDCHDGDGYHRGVRSGRGPGFSGYRR